MELPEPAIRWLVKNSSSNTELASLTNVCKKWRTIVSGIILDQAKVSRNSKSQKYLLLPSLIRCLLRQGMDDDPNTETYCLTWFHPAGILSKQLPLDPMNDSDDEGDFPYLTNNRGESPQHFAPNGQESYLGSEDEKNASRRQQSSRSPTPLTASGLRRNEKIGDKYVSCMYQWNSYQEAKDILYPFGFSYNFIKSIIYQAKSIVNSKSKNMPATRDSNQEYRTYAVRGATFARPEGYCLCWDEDLPRIESRFGNVSVDLMSNQQQHELNRLTRRRIQRRREVQREVLPRVVYSNPYKVSEDQPGVGTQLAVQFLNVDFSHAVRLFTPPFQPGPVSTPITLFCVAIATEDGCFLSGLRHRFEFGHLYPESAKDNLIERSPICICTNFGEEPTYQGESGEFVYKKIDSDNSDDSSCDMCIEGASCDPPAKCACPMSGLGHITDESDDDYKGHICRGKRGPGTWHCYAVVVDGNSSEIRVDGISEPLQCSRSIGENTPAYLDGLTIGADHTFDMSLCFGQGSDGEGEGAISELAVFKGRLDLVDVKAIETYLMKEHGITPSFQSGNNIQEKDDYARLAHAMLSHPPHHKIFADGKKSVPLRYMTKHRSVAWKQVNEVTGESIRVSRIGTKTTDSSSEW